MKFSVPDLMVIQDNWKLYKCEKNQGGEESLEREDDGLVQG